MLSFCCEPSSIMAILFIHLIRIIYFSIVVFSFTCGVDEQKHGQQHSTNNIATVEVQND